ncbi:hypothetical protein EAH73_18760 [Hymenobacter nivis]|uniref:Uncharacterized protein n=1 Tax=Hymenobacter nivis TaxID=1850093 RepID=A0A502GMN8_9BACT|nr:hypothetical protein EAH73_18760 [Hymenobacter nivis]
MSYAVLIRLSAGYPPDLGRLATRYAPVRHYGIATTVRLACIRPAASVHPEPGSNSPLYNILHLLESKLLSCANSTRIDEFKSILRLLNTLPNYSRRALPFVFSKHSKNVCRFHLKQQCDY